jgi:N-acetylmuramoyl-L-alanine amidase
MRAALVGVIVAIASCAPAAPPAKQGSFVPTAIVLHSTSGLDLRAAIERMDRQGTGVHFLVNPDGTVTPHTPADRPARAARGMDDAALHVSEVGGIGRDLLADPRLLDATAALVGSLASRFSIPPTNADVASRRGVFSHQQAKYRFGGLRSGEERGRMEPGEEFMAALLPKIGGRYVEEKDWAGRSGEGWACVWEGGGNLGSRGDLTRGRGLTPMVRPAPPLEMSEARRMRYVDRGPMKEVRGVVLHFTATRTWDEAVATFERRRLGPSIIVDTDGRAWQVVDKLSDKVAAAAGTNDHCIQVEIVGENEDALLGNAKQLKGVVKLLKGLSGDFPLDNRDIDSLRGVFSHGQAKKRWGRSAWMWGTDFDPGERYMKRVLEEAGGRYWPEADWNGRSSGQWVIEDEDWLP